MPDLINEKSEVVSFTPQCTYEDGDMIIRSTDGIEFRVHRWLLRQASTLLNEMFSPPKPSNRLEIQSIAMPGETLDHILRCIYPVKDAPIVISIEHGVSLLLAAEKLDVPCAVTRISNSMAPLLYTERNPYRAWAISRRFKIEGARQDAIRRFILSEDDFLTLIPSEMTLVDAYACLELQELKKRAIHKARDAIAISYGPCAAAKAGSAEMLRDRNPLVAEHTSELHLASVRCDPSRNCYHCTHEKRLQSNLRSQIQKIVENVELPDTPRRPKKY